MASSGPAPRRGGALPRPRSSRAVVSLVRGRAPCDGDLSARPVTDAVNRWPRRDGFGPGPYMGSPPIVHRCVFACFGDEWCSRACVRGARRTRSHRGTPWRSLRLGARRGGFRVLCMRGRGRAPPLQGVIAWRPVLDAGSEPPKHRVGDRSVNRKRRPPEGTASRRVVRWSVQPSSWIFFSSLSASLRASSQKSAMRKSEVRTSW